MGHEGRQVDPDVVPGRMAHDRGTATGPIWARSKKTNAGKRKGGGAIGLPLFLGASLVSVLVMFCNGRVNTRARSCLRLSRASQYCVMANPQNRRMGPSRIAQAKSPRAVDGTRARAGDPPTSLPIWTENLARYRWGRGGGTQRLCATGAGGESSRVPAQGNGFPAARKTQAPRI